MALPEKVSDSGPRSAARLLATEKAVRKSGGVIAIDREIKALFTGIAD